MPHPPASSWVVTSPDVSLDEVLAGKLAASAAPVKFPSSFPASCSPSKLEREKGKRDALLTVPFVEEKDLRNLPRLVMQELDVEEPTPPEGEGVHVLKLRLFSVWFSSSFEEDGESDVSLPMKLDRKGYSCNAVFWLAQSRALYIRIPSAGLRGVFSARRR